MELMASLSSALLVLSMQQVSTQNHCNEPRFASLQVFSIFNSPFADPVDFRGAEDDSPPVETGMYVGPDQS